MSTPSKARVLGSRPAQVFAPAPDGGKVKAAFDRVQLEQEQRQLALPVDTEWLAFEPLPSENTAP